MNRPISYLYTITKFFFSLFVLLQPISIYTQTAQQIVKKTFPSVVLLIMEDANGQPLSIGSGFFVSTGEIASNLHVIEGAARGYVKLIGENTIYDIEGITAIDPERDIVILKIATTGSHIITLGNSDLVQVGDVVYTIGNPQGLEGTFSQGIVSSIREVGADKLIQITAPISPGSSGGPVLNVKGEVIGISAATFQGGQNLNFAIPSCYLNALLDSKEPVKPLSKAILTIKKSILRDFGSESTEGVLIENLIWDSKFFIDGYFSYTIKNRLREPVKDVEGLFIFYDLNGNPIDFKKFSCTSTIPGGLGKRVNGRVDKSVKRLSTRALPGYNNSHDRPEKIEYRILSFDVIKGNVDY